MNAQTIAADHSTAMARVLRDGIPRTHRLSIARARRALLKPLLAVTLAAAGTLTAPGLLAYEHGWRGAYDHEFREHEFRDPRYFDHRYGHDRYYPPVGFVFAGLPPGYVTLYAGGARLYFGGGVWYRAYAPGRYVVVAPPLGVMVPVLPPGYATVWVGNVPYYYANDAYYVQTPQGYMVAAPPSNGQPGPPPAPGQAYIEKPPQTPPPPPIATGPAPVPPSASGPPAAAASQQLSASPQRHQTPDQQARDRYECHGWAVNQSGFDPSNPSTSGATGAQADGYRRAMSACLEARGYSVN